VRKSAAEVQAIRAAGEVVAEVLASIGESLRPGMTTAELDELAATVARSRGSTPAFQGYRGFPARLCVSVNDTVVHGIPGERVLRDGDLVSVDFACFKEGFCADGAETFFVGEASVQARRLVSVTREALWAGIGQARAGGRVGDIGAAIQRHVEAAGYSVVRTLVGHGVGRELHEPPQVPNFGVPGSGVKLEPGMVLAIEPMVNCGGAAVKVLDDGWSVVTTDKSLSAHIEHTVAITTRGAEVLTQLCRR